MHHKQSMGHVQRIQSRSARRLLEAPVVLPQSVWRGNEKALSSMGSKEKSEGVGMKWFRLASGTLVLTFHFPN